MAMNNEAQLKEAVTNNQNGDLELAKQQCQQVLDESPQSVSALRLMGAICGKQEDYPTAIQSLEACLLINPEDRAVKHMLATILSDSGRYIQAQDVFDQLLAGSVSDGLIIDCALNLSRMGYWQEAADALTRLLEHVPDNSKAKYNLAEIFLLHGQFEQAWSGYELRYEKDRLRMVLPDIAPIWKGEALKDKTIAIWREQGLGDELLSGSCYQEIAQSARKTILFCNPRLIQLFQRSFPRCECIDISESEAYLAEHKDIDFQIKAESLFQYLRRFEQQFPHEKGYLKPCSEKVGRFKEQLNQLPGDTSIGISWMGGNNRFEVNGRSMRLSELEDLLMLPNMNFVVLQHGDVSGEVAALERKINVQLHRIEGADPMGDFDDYGALIAALDGVVSVDNSVASLAGSLGVTSWLMLPVNSDWWWPYKKENLWMPSIRGFRKETTTQHWQPVIDKMVADLQKEFAG